MADKKKKKEQTNVGGRGVSTKSYKPQRQAKTASADVSPAAGAGVIRKLSHKAKMIIIMAVCAALLVGAIVPIIIIVVRNHRINSFDYLKSDLSRYVDFSEEYYKDYPLILDIAKPHVKREDGTGVSDVEIAILSMLAKDKGGKTIGGMTTEATEIAVGDDVYFWYRGYVIEDGKEVDVTSLMNFYKEESNIRGESNAITVGRGSFAVAGVEGGLIGINTGDYAKFVKITEGEVKAGQVVYISCERTPVGGTAADKQTGSCVRIDLADTETAAVWLPILEGAAIGSEVDDFRVTVDGVEYDYVKTKVEFVTECENGEGKPTLTIEGYAPYDFSIVQLRNETIYVELYIAGVQRRNEWHNKGFAEYTIDYDWNDAYVSEKLEAEELDITAEELDEYAGSSLTEKYEAYALKRLNDSYKESLKQMTEDAMWEYYLKRAIVKEYPELKVNEIFKEYREDVENQFRKSGGYIYNMYTGSNVTCADINEYAVIYLNLQYEEDQNWENYLRRLSESLVAERLILYYIMKEENLTPKGSDFNKRYEALRQEYLDEYIKQDGTDTSEYTEEEYEEYVEECKKTLFDYYDEEYFKETTYYEMVVESMINYAKVYTLDDIPARDRQVFNIITGWI